LLPEDLRFSRAIVVLGATASLASMIVLRYLLHHVVGFKVFEKKRTEKNALWVHSKKENRMENEGLSLLYSKVYVLNIDDLTDLSEDYLNPYKKILQVNTLIFDAESFSYASIVFVFEKLKNLQFQYKIKNPDCDFLVGGDEVQWLSQQWKPEQIEGYKKAVQRKKRQFDVLFSILILLPCMFLAIFSKYSRVLLDYSLFVLRSSSAAWVGTIKKNKTYAWIYLLEVDSSISSDHQNEIISEYYKNYSFKRDFLLLFNTIFKK
jgi:hypothetical protein